MNLEEYESDLWRVSALLGQEVAIWPNDSIHLATAILEGCSLFITDDKDFLDKIDFGYRMIEDLRDTALSLVPNLPTFYYTNLSQNYVPKNISKMTIVDKINLELP